MFSFSFFLLLHSSLVPYSWHPALPFGTNSMAMRHLVSNQYPSLFSFPPFLSKQAKKRVYACVLTRAVVSPLPPFLSAHFPFLAILAGVRVCVCLVYRHSFLVPAAGVRVYAFFSVLRSYFAPTPVVGSLVLNIEERAFAFVFFFLASFLCLLFPLVRCGVSICVRAVFIRSFPSLHSPRFPHSPTSFLAIFTLLVLLPRSPASFVLE